MSANIVGIDIGGSHITAALIDLDKRQIVEGTVCRQTVNAGGAPEDIFSDWCAAIKQCIQSSTSEVYIGIAMPGPFNYEEGISYIKDQDKYKSLYSINIKIALAAQLDIPPEYIQFTNDAVCFLKGEVFAGIAKHCKTVWGFTLGTGLGSTFYNGGTVVDGNLWCLPFKEGIAEDYFSTRWFVKRYEEKTNQRINGVKDLEDLYAKDESIREIFNEFGKNFADFLRHIFQQFFLPEMVVLGGNISKGYQYFEQPLQKQLGEYNLQLTIKTSSLKENASLLGAASYWYYREKQPLNYR